MLILQENKEGTWFDFTARGVKIRLKIRSLSSSDVTKIRKKHKRSEYAKDSEKRGMVKVEFFDEDAILLDTIDHVLEDFTGIGESPGCPLPATPENKKRLMDVSPADGERSIADFIFEKARELNAVSESELEADQKN